MILARACGEFADELACDMMQVYHIEDPDTLPPSLFATLAAGLPEDSRTMRALSGRKTDTGTLLLASAVDRLSLLVWMNTKDGAKGRNRPNSIVERLTREGKEEQEKAFSVPVDEFDETLRKIRES